MKGKCPRCREDQALVAQAPCVVLHALPQLKSPLEVTVPFTCPNCGCEVSSNIRFVATDKRVVSSGLMSGQPTPERRFGQLWGLYGRRSTHLTYSGVFAPGQNVLFPEHEGTLGGGHAIGRHGDPDLMAEFSAEYLKQYRVIVPKGRLPHTVSEMMPALHLLVNAAELAMKADLIRSDNESGGHSLAALYGHLDCRHKDEIARRFADSEITCAEARRHGIAPVPRSHPAYRYMRDGDGDGVVCE